MAGKSSAQYVAQFGPTLSALTNRTRPMVNPAQGGPLAAGTFQDQQADFQGQQLIDAGEATPGALSQLDTPALGRGAFTMPQQPQGALALAGPKPAAAPAIAPAEDASQAAGKGTGFWDLAKELSEDDKDKITKDFEKQGVDVESEYEKLAAAGKVDAGLIKRGEDGKIDRRDMGLFLMEFGLRTMAAGGKGQDALGAIGEGALGTMEGRRARAKGALEDETQALDKKTARGLVREQESTRQAERGEDQANERRKEKLGLAAKMAEDESRRTDAAADRKSREKIAAMQAAAVARGERFYVDAEGYRRQSTDNAIVTDPQGQPVKEPLRPGAAGNRPISERDKAELYQKIATDVQADRRFKRDAALAEQEIQRRYSAAIAAAGGQSGTAIDFDSLPD